MKQHAERISSEQSIIQYDWSQEVKS